jgi:hypothetical protein
MKNSWILPVATLAIGAAGGYISGKNNDAGTPPPANEQTSSRSRSANRTGPGTAGAESTKRSNRGSSTQEIARMPGNSSRVQALLEFYSSLSADQLAQEAGKLEALPMNERMMASFLLFGRWAEVDPQAAMSFSGTMGMAGNFVRPTVLQSWASVDPAGAAKYLQSNPREFAMMGMFGGGRGGQGGQGGASIIASEWARQDPAAALAWASTLSADKGQAMTSVIGEVAKTDPRKAAGMIANMDDADRQGAYSTVASQYGSLDFAEAQTWIKSLPAADQADALAAAIGGLANNDPAAAVKQVNAMADSDAKNRLIPNVVEDLARRDPQAAADFLKSQTNEDAQRNGMRQLMPAWTNTNPNGALQYANSFPAGTVRDGALQSWVMSNNSSAPKDVIQVAATIQDDRDRSRSIMVPAMKWMREDPVAAKEYIQTSTDVPDDMKKNLIDGGGGWGGRGRGRGN